MSHLKKIKSLNIRKLLKRLGFSREKLRTALLKLNIKGVIPFQNLLYDLETDNIEIVKYSVNQNLDYSAKAVVESDKYKAFFRKRDLSKETSTLKIHFDVKVVGKVPYIIKGKSIVLDGFLDEKTATWEEPIKRNLLAIPIFFPSRLIEIDKAIVVFSRFYQNYYHWWLDFITKFEQLDRHEIPTKNVLIKKLFNEYEIESIKPFRKKYNIIEVLEDTTYHVKEAYTPLMSSISGQTSNRKIDFIRKEFYKTNSTECLLVYVSRQDALFRKIENHDEFLKLIKNYGFKEYLLEKMRLQEQIELFKKAKVVLAPHGAGLANLVFSGKGVKIIELFNKDYLNSCYFEIAEYLEADYYYYVDETENMNYKINVDINQFRKFLDNFFEK